MLEVYLEFYDKSLHRKNDFKWKTREGNVVLLLSSTY